jgi:Calx-beta domain/FG-GAP repeat/FG-GAP-like repeat
MKAMAGLSLAVLLAACGNIVDDPGDDDGGDGADGADDGGDDGDDGGGGARLSVIGTTVREGDTAGGRALFAIQLSAPVAGEVSVSFATEDDTAREADGDYVPFTGTVSLAAGETVANVEVAITGDFRSEPDERVRLLIDDPSGAAIDVAEAVAVIDDDDRGPDFNGDGFADIVISDPGAVAGEVYVFLGDPDAEAGGVSESFGAADADVIISGQGRDRERFGSQVAAGDLNGDGFDDVVAVASVGPPEAAVAIAFVFAGSASPESTIGADDADVVITGPVGVVPAANLAVVDLEGDGPADLVIGGDDGARLYAGSDSFTGGLELGPDDADVTFVGDANTFFPAAAGDFDGDGVDDLVVSTSSFTEDATAHLFLGGRGLSGLIGLAIADATFAVTGSTSVVGAGGADMNGDRRADIVLGSPGLNANDGAAMVFFGIAEPAGVLQADVTINSEADIAQFGAAVSLAGNLDGDGFGDLVAGLPIADPPNAMNGGIGMLFLGASAPPPTLGSSARDLEVQADGGGDGLARTVAVLDYNGDGFGDLVLGSPESGVDNQGNVYMFLGFAGAFRDGEPIRSVADADVSFEAGTANNSFGTALAE